MKTFASGLLAALIGTLMPSMGSAFPVVPGLANKHPLSQPEVGRLLLNELRCVACHNAKNIPSVERTAPDLTDVGSRVAADYLRRFIASPSAAHVGTAMPDLLAAESPQQRDKIAEAITHFLLAQSPRKFQHQKLNESEITATSTSLGGGPASSR